MAKKDVENKKNLYFYEDVEKLHKRKEAIKAEKRNQKTAKEIEILSGIPSYRTIMEIRHMQNNWVSEIAKTFYGDDVTRGVTYGDNLNFVFNGIQDKGNFSFGMSGMSYVTAVLLSEGMSLETIINPNAELEAKKNAGKRVQEMANRGDDGRREMALLSAKAIKILQKKEDTKTFSYLVDTMDHVSNFKSNFEMQMMLDLKHEVEHSLNLKEALEYQLQQENLDLSKEEAAYKANVEYANILDLGKSSERRQAFYNGIERKMFDNVKMVKALGVPIESEPTEKTDITFQKKCFEKMYKDLLEVDPIYIKSSAEFKGMRKSLEAILTLYKKAEKTINNFKEGESKFDERKFYHELESRCEDLEKFNKKYIDVKKGIQPEEGSNAQKRLDFACGMREFVKEAHNMAKNADIDYIKSLKKKNELDMESVKNTIDRCYDIASPSTKPKYIPVGEFDLDFVNKNFQIKTVENNFEVPKNLGITEKQASLLVMLSLGTVEVGKEYRNVPKRCDDPEAKTYIAVAIFTEDTYNKRNSFETDKMPLVERGRGVVKQALKAYENNDKAQLAKLLAEGLKRYSATFSQYKDGFEGSSNEKAMVAYKLGGDIYDMLSQNKQLQELLMDKSLGDDKVTKETLQNYRAAKASYEICKKALDAKHLLLDLSLLKEKSSYTIQLRKEALAALVLKNILHKEVKHTSETYFNNVNKYVNETYRERDNLDKNSEEYDELDDKALVDTMALSAKASISKVQRELTSEKVRDYLEKLTKSKTIEKMEKYLDPTMLDSFEYEESFCEKVVETIMKEEASVLNVKEMQAETNIQKEIQLNL